jgi:hypothetical protein
MSLDPVTVNLGALPDGAGGDTQRVAVQKITDALNAIIAAINSGDGGGGGGAPFDPTSIEAEIAAEVQARTDADTALHQYIDDQIAAIPTGGGTTGGVDLTTFNAEVTNRTNGDAGLRTYIDQQIAALNAGGTTTFKGNGTGAVVRPLRDKLLDQPVSLLDYYNSTTDGGDYAPAFNRAVAVSLRVQIPVGTFNFNNPVPIVEAMHVEGCGRDFGGSVTTIVGSKGVFINTGDGAGHRKHMTLGNLALSGGSKTGGATLIKGPLGGSLRSVGFHSCARGIDSNSAFLLNLYECRFESIAEFGITVADFNGCRVQDGYFSTSVNCHLSMVDTPPGVGDFQPGFPWVICGNNITGGGGNTGMSLFKVNGLGQFVDNYFEDESASGSDSQIVFVEVIVDQFAGGGISFRNNEMNGLSHSKHAIIVRNKGVTAQCNGVITGNRIGAMKLGNAAEHIHFGLRDSTSNAHVEGLRIMDNTDSKSQAINIGNGSPYRPAATSYITYSTPIAIAGATPVNLPLGGAADFDNRAMFGPAGTSGMAIQKAGLFDFKFRITIRSAGSVTYPNVVAHLLVNGVVMETQNQQLVATGGQTTFGQIALGIKQNFAIGDTIKIEAFNGEVVSKVSAEGIWAAPKDGWA